MDCICISVYLYHLQNTNYLYFVLHKSLDLRSIHTCCLIIYLSLIIMKFGNLLFSCLISAAVLPQSLQAPPIVAVKVGTTWTR
jgi:hypothetical protein